MPLFTDFHVNLQSCFLILYTVNNVLISKFYTLLFKSLSDYADLAQAVAAFTFEYGRLKLLQNEQELLTEYFSQQKQLDEDLEKKFIEYRDSVELANAADVKEEEMLDCLEKVDSFFTD